MMEPLNVPNLDCIDDNAELVQLQNAFEALARYASHRLQARYCRLASDTAGALRHEHRMDTLYAELPEWARW